jgi:7,8-dihydropterin-6-yl-methyl-4-(beta-D-ribofuranosyl)aminobenzene 5'-phosphate synthase
VPKDVYWKGVMQMSQDSLPDDVLRLDDLQILVVVDNETDTLSSVDEGVPQIPEVVHLAARTPPSRMHDGHDCKVVFDQLCCACHGLSVLVTGRRGDEKHSMLFDVGPYPDIWLDNARRLGVDLSTIENVFLSHWHFDHSGGFPRVVAAIREARARAGLARPIVDLHPNRPDQRGILLPSGARSVAF